MPNLLYQATRKARHWGKLWRLPTAIVRWSLWRLPQDYKHLAGKFLGITMESLKNLSLEKQASAAVFLQQIKKMSKDEAIDLLGKMYVQQLLREDAYNGIIRKAWGIPETTSQTPRL